MTTEYLYPVPDCEECGKPGGAFGLGSKHLCISCVMGWNNNVQVVAGSTQGVIVNTDGQYYWYTINTETDQLRQRAEAAELLLGEVSEPLEHMGSATSCLFCGEMAIAFDEDEHPFPHTDNCLWMRIKQYLSNS